MQDASQPAWWRRFEVPLLLGAVLLRLLYLGSILDNPYFAHPVTDEGLYDTWARSILAHDEITQGLPYFNPPLHAYFLASIYWVFGHNLLAVRLVQVIIGTFNVALLYWIARRLFDEGSARVVGVVAATYLPFLYYEGLLLKESLALFLLDLSMFLLLYAIARPHHAAFWGSGAVVGLLALTRVNALALVPAALGAMWLRRDLPRAAPLAYLLGVLIVIAPVTVRNYMASGEWVFITVYGGQALYNANNPTNTTGDYAPLPDVRPNPKFERIDFQRLAERETGRELSPKEASDYWAKKAFEFAVTNPLTQARMIGWRVLRFWNYGEMPDNHSYDQFKEFTWMLRLPLPGFWFIGPLALLGLFVLRKRWHEFSALYLYLGCYMVSLLPFWVFSRYRMPIAGVLILFAVPALFYLGQLARSFRLQDIRFMLKPALGVVASCVVCWLPLARPPLSTHERNLAYAYEQSGQYDKAIAIYEQLRKIERNPDNDLFLANALGQAGRTEDADALLGRFTRDNQPAQVRQSAFNFLGDLARGNKRWGQAERAYRSALRLDHKDYGAWNNLAVVLVQQKRYREAEEALQQSITIAPEDKLAQRNLIALRQYLSDLEQNGQHTPTSRKQGE